jgi:dTDP-4-amino-4,6-dideoxygalactose transaminase
MEKSVSYNCYWSDLIWQFTYAQSFSARGISLPSYVTLSDEEIKEISKLLLAKFKKII